MKGTVAKAAVLFSWVLLKFCPGVATVLDGLGTIGTGASAISTGISLFGCNLVLNVLGVISIVVGAATVAAGVNQVVCGAIGVNVMKETFHMSDGAYEALYLGANIASLVCVVTGRIAAGLKGIQCFIGGTLVATEDGLKPIEEIEVGDKVLAYDEETGEQAYKKVVKLFQNETYEWYHIFVNDEEIVCTGGHPFYVLNAEEGRKIVRYEGVTPDKNGRWIEAKELKISDKLLLSDGTYAIIKSIKIETLESPETTYNFEVADFHTYFVSESNVLVHNMCKQKLVAGSEDGWNAKVSVGGETNHKTPHAHVNWKNQKLASVDVDGNTLVESKMNKSMQRKMYKFIQKNIKDISAGIKKYY